MKNIQSLAFWIVLITCIAALSGCANNSRQQVITGRLIALDAQLDCVPQTVLDSLTAIPTRRLSSFNKGYRSMLQTIAEDKTGVDFRSDSQINKSVKILYKHKKKYPNPYARSLMYQGVVRYRMGITDSTAYAPIKEAVQIMETYQIKDSKTLLFCYNYLGQIHSANNNLQLSVDYLKEAIHEAKKYGNRGYLFSIYRDLFWEYMQKNDLNNSKQYLDILNSFHDISTLQIADKGVCKASYYERTKEYEKALEANLNVYKILQLPTPSTLFRLSTNYLYLNQLDSALYYFELAEKAIPDTSSYFNYVYYENTGKIAERLQLWEKSAEAYKKGIHLREKGVEKELDTQIMELEKKYNLTQIENKVLKYKNHFFFLV